MIFVKTDERGSIEDGKREKRDGGGVKDCETKPWMHGTYGESTPLQASLWKTFYFNIILKILLL